MQRKLSYPLLSFFEIMISTIFRLHPYSLAMYFFNIFYGGFKENREQWPKIKDVNSDAICAGIADTVIRSMKFPDILALHLPMLNWSIATDVIEHFDRFSFIQKILKT